MADFATSGKRHNPRRRNKDVVKATELAAAGDVDAAEERTPGQPWMEPKDDWSPEVTAIFMSMKSDVMGQFMTPAGWAVLYLKCSAWDMEFKEKFLGITHDGELRFGKSPLPPGVLADITKTMDSFGASEKARREMKILIDPNPDESNKSLAGDAKMAAQKAVVRPVRRQLGA